MRSRPDRSRFEVRISGLLAVLLTGLVVVAAARVSYLTRRGGPRFESPRTGLKMRDTMPSCFSGDKGFPHSAGTRATQNLVTCVYQTKLAGHCRLVTVTWCKNVMCQGLSVSVDDPSIQTACKVDLKPWYFWRKHGVKSFEVGGIKVDVYWDLGSAKFLCGPEPQGGYYVAVVCDREVVLLLGDMKHEAYGKTRCRPAAIEATLISRKEHVFGKKYFATKTRFDEAGGKPHDISIECHTTGPRDPEMFIKVDGQVVVEVKRLLWKFRGNETIYVNGIPVQVFWDVHDWLFNPGPGHALFMFKPVPGYQPEKNGGCQGTCRKSSAVQGLKERGDLSGVSDYCLLLYAWKLD